MSLKNIIQCIKNGELKENWDMIIPWRIREIIRRIWYEDYKSTLTKEKIKKLLKKENPIILDIGANNGRDAREFLLTFKNPKVYCFEPDLRAIRKFKNRMKDDSRCKLFEIAISDKDGTDIFYLSGGGKMKGGWDASSSIKKPIKPISEGAIFDKKVIVKTKKLDTWVKENNIKRIDFMWVDVQGAEREVIKGGIKTLKEKVEYFYTEFGNDQFYEGAPKLEEILELLPTFKMIGIFNGNVLLKNTKLID